MDSRTVVRAYFSLSCASILRSAFATILRELDINAPFLIDFLYELGALEIALLVLTAKPKTLQL